MLKKAFVISGLCLITTMAWAQQYDVLKKGFENPPTSAWPRTWWHWTHSNVTKEGITKDLEWMKRVGIEGFQLADVAAGGGQVVSKKTIFGTEEWLDAVHHTAVEAERLDLEMATFTSAGWSLTGGSWVQPEQAMKKLVWSTVRVDGSKTYHTKLPEPSSRVGAGPNVFNTNTKAGPYYADHVVIAFRTPEAELAAGSMKPSLRTDRGAEDGRALYDGDMSTSISVQRTVDGNDPQLLLTYPDPVKARALTIAAGTGIPFARVAASMDGVSFKTLTHLPGKSGYRGGNIRTYAFPETEARYYRLEFTNAPVRPADVISENTTPVDSLYKIAEIRLHTGARVNRWEDKAGFNMLFEYSGVETPEVPENARIPKGGIIDLTSKMKGDGTLHWQVPEGNWTIMRFGYALTGAKNRPAVPEAQGYEVDKLSKEHTGAYIRHYTSLLKRGLGPLFGQRLQYMLMDSWEAGIQNWTDKMAEEFKARRGYSLLPFLPVMAGYIVGDAETSDRFLWDFRRTLVDMFAENHYGTVTDYLNSQGVKTYGEAGGVSLESMEDALLNKKYVDIPMGEFWVKDLHPSSMYYQDIRGAASSAHVYGKKLVAAEAFTGGNFESPFTLKKIGDYWFTQGVNRLVFHTSAHQPLDTKPGNAMVGTHLHRNITWAEDARPLFTHFARNAYMLQRGIFVADVAYLLKEGAPSTMPFWGGGLKPELPEGYDYDYINTDALIGRMQADSTGQLVLPDAMSYALLVLPDVAEMTLHVLKKIKSLLECGATVVGPRPEKMAGLDTAAYAEAEFIHLVDEIWADLDGKSRTRREYGQGRLFWGLSLKKVLKAIGVPKDAELSYSAEKTAWIHRKVDDTDVYYVVNRTDETQHIRGRFRVAGKNAELWNPDEGTIGPAAYRITDKFTEVPVELPAGGSTFVVFSGSATEQQRTVAYRQEETLAEIQGPWQVSFPPNSGAPEEIELKTLGSLSTHPQEGVKYFSGKANYRQTISVKKDWLTRKGNVYLDLGKVSDIASVSVNGKKMPLVWKAPFRVDITQALGAGDNDLEVEVTNGWTNRLAGDKLFPDKKVLDGYVRPFGGPYQLQESGLLGPVRIVMEKEQP
ncbi:glycoside hydrolase [Echinicola soli]|uniref:Glycoside hydrolase n=1 Tax=Echinicola soli TaxID=2591634 RepID=A0A514CPC0_9BACT|nr:glycoside hydrolase [Echinicola soli]